jgi:hypothetical protein
VQAFLVLAMTEMCLGLFKNLFRPDLLPRGVR